MPLSEFIRRASFFILGADEPNLNVCHYEDNEILFCKNNVCVHSYRSDTSAILLSPDTLHNPGYLTVTTKVFIDQYNDSKRPTLFLTWIPNGSLAKAHHERVSIGSSPFKSSLESLVSNDSTSNSSSTLNVTGNPFLCTDDVRLASDESSDDSCTTSLDAQPHHLININVNIANPDIEIISRADDLDQRELAINIDEKSFDFDEFRSSSACSHNNNTNNTLNAHMDNISDSWSCSHGDTGGHGVGVGGGGCDSDFSTGSPIPLRKHHRVRRFSVDLSQMRSLRLFFSDKSCTCGQMVIASRESQYKILHFHYGGLDHLAQVLHQWHSLLHNINRANGTADDSLPYRHFMVCRPGVSDLELHPEEHQVPKLTEQLFRGMFNEHGQLEDDLMLRKLVFFAGMERQLRKQVWPFLLHVYPYYSTYLERIQIVELRRAEYTEIQRRRIEMNGQQLAHFRRHIKSVIDKDVVRTDRGNPFFAGDQNTHLDMMKNILLNYAVYNPTLGYTQGMSDLLAPVLCELGDEVSAFWCFVGLMQRAVFVATPTDHDMDRCLKYLRELIRIMVPHFHQHLEKHKDANELLFCHRWILLCFKREFTEGVALRMWEACWSNYLTDYFHLFLCLSIICVYADDVIAQDLRADEMLLHFSSLAMYMDGHVITRKARGLLHQFRQLREIPCTLSGLCTKCGPGIWDSAHSPRVYCVGHDAPGQCLQCNH